jgi:hypothetical protein
MRRTARASVLALALTAIVGLASARAQAATWKSSDRWTKRGLDR